MYNEFSTDIFQSNVLKKLTELRDTQDNILNEISNIETIENVVTDGTSGTIVSSKLFTFCNLIKLLYAKIYPTSNLTAGISTNIGVLDSLHKPGYVFGEATYQGTIWMRSTGGIEIIPRNNLATSDAIYVALMFLDIS